MMSKRKLTLLIAFFAAATASGEELISVRPSETDSRITEFNSRHRVWLPEGEARNELLIFLPGTGGTPENNFPRAFEVTAASLGYHVIALAYPDSIAAQTICSRSNDPDAYLKFRNGIIRGGEIGRGRKIAVHDSIESRLKKLLAYLRARQPDRGWDRFLSGGEEIRWRSVAVAGQSQGGGHSYMLGKNHELARVLMFGSPKDYSFRFDAPAKGFDANTRTPTKRFFAYNHVRDTAGGCDHEQQAKIFKQIGLNKLGIATADNPLPSFGHAHVLYTDVVLQDSSKLHGAPLNGHVAANPPVWKYMLTEPVD
jgi:hypothetical protein